MDEGGRRRRYGGREIERQAERHHAASSGLTLQASQRETAALVRSVRL